MIVPAISNESKTGFIAPIEGELEKSFRLNYNPALQREEMCYGLVMCAERTSRSGLQLQDRQKRLKNTLLRTYLLLEHRGMETCYGCHSEVLVEEGEVVEQGQVVAEIKLNPYQNRASFYFEIRDKGEPVDPLPLIIE